MYGCVCPPEFTGVQCENRIEGRLLGSLPKFHTYTRTFFSANHPCVTIASTLCKNGGTCTLNGADYLCKCAAGWTGRNCETKARM